MAPPLSCCHGLAASDYSCALDALDLLRPLVFDVRGECSRKIKERLHFGNLGKKERKKSPELCRVEGNFYGRQIFRLRGAEED